MIAAGGESVVGWRVRLLAAAVVVIVLPGLASATAQSSTAIDLTDRAAKLILEERLGEALVELDRVLEREPDYWKAHYQRGRALALQGHMAEARDALVHAVALNPGFAHGHYLAWLAALRTEDYATAWEQAILAELAGTDMSEQFKELMAVSDTPTDILQRLGAPRVFVAPFDTADIEAAAELPYNRNPNVEENRLSQRPDEIQGAFRLQEATPELLNLHRELRRAIQRAPYVGLTLDPRGASIYVQLTIDTLGERSPRQLAGTLEAIEVEGGSVRWGRDILLRDISSQGSVTLELERHVGEMEAEIGYRPDH